MRARITLNFLGAIMFLFVLGGVGNAQAKPAAAAYTGCTNPGDQTDMPEAECNALVALYDGTTGASWTTSTDWKATDTPCSWWGVNCISGKVTELDLPNNNLDGNIPTQLGNLSTLTYLGLYNNSLTGSIPTELGTLSNLQHLLLYGNYLNGSIPPELGSLNSLIRLHLYNNSLSGSIPAELGSLSNLTHLYLLNNNLTGSIPAELGDLSNLIEIDLGQNSLSGNIPSQLGNLTNLLGIWFHENSLSGSIPTQLGNLTNLLELILNNNSAMSGTLPGSFINLSGLTTFGFSGTSLCEPSDTAFQTWLDGVTTVYSSGLTCPLVNASFESPIGAEWTQVNSGNPADNRHLHAGSYDGDYLYALKAVGVTEYIMQSVAISGGLSGDAYSLSSYFAGVNLASQGAMGHFVRVMNGASVVDTFACVFARPGASFGWTQHTCNFTTTGSYDAVEVYIFILNIPSGIAAFDAVDLLQTGP